MSENGQQPKEPTSNQTAIWKQTSELMARSLWIEFKEKRIKTMGSYDLTYRVRLAHMLLMHFEQIYYNPNFKGPTPESQEFLVKSVLSLGNPHTWCTVRNRSG